MNRLGSEEGKRMVETMIKNIRNTFKIKKENKEIKQRRNN